MANIEIEGLEPLLKKLDTVAGMKAVKAGLKAGGIHVKGKIAQYPPHSSANISHGPGSSWYVRGTGGFYHRMRDGGISNYGGSETLGKKWTIKARRGGMTVVVGNNVSYGPYVQGDEQMSYHKARNWKTTDEVAKKEGAHVNKLIVNAINAALR